MTGVTQLPNALLGKTNKENDKNLFTLLHFLLTSSAEATITIEQSKDASTLHIQIIHSYQQS